MYYINYPVKPSKCLHLENLKKEVLLPWVCIRREVWSFCKGFKNSMCGFPVVLHAAQEKRNTILAKIIIIIIISKESLVHNNNNNTGLLL